MDNKGIKKLEADLWESADLLRVGSKLTSNQYCIPVLGLLFLRYAYSRYNMVEEEILKVKGVTVYHSKQGTDGGKDLLASGGEMGFGSPKVCVQVKT